MLRNVLLTPSVRSERGRLLEDLYNLGLRGLLLYLENS